MYWTARATIRHGPKIQRANLDGTQVEDLLTLTSERGLVSSVGLALDLDAGKMYWTDRGTTRNRARIQRANLDGTQVEDLLTLQLGLATGPVGLALDLGAGKMYWTGQDPGKIQRANLDGTEVEDLVTFGSGWPVWRWT